MCKYPCRTCVTARNCTDTRDHSLAQLSSTLLQEPAPALATDPRTHSLPEITPGSGPKQGKRPHTCTIFNISPTRGAHDRGNETHLAQSSPASPSGTWHARSLVGSHALRPLCWLAMGLGRHVAVLLYMLLDMPHAGPGAVRPGGNVHGASRGTGMGPLRCSSRYSVRLRVLIAHCRRHLQWAGRAVWHALDVP